MSRSRLSVSAAAAALLILAVAAPAFGTPSVGVISAPIIARGDFVERVDVKFKTRTAHGIVVSNAPDAGEVVVQEITIGPNGTTGWHSHPGPVVVVVKSGALTFVEEEKGACTQRTYVAGTAFVDPGQGHTHMAFNPSSSQNLVLVATYFDVPVGASPRIEVATVPAAC